MSKKNDLVTVTKLVKDELENDIFTRGNDNRLIRKVLEGLLREGATLKDVEMSFEGNIYETISRVRRKIQADDKFSNLRPSAEIIKDREENIKDFIEFARR